MMSKIKSFFSNITMQKAGIIGAVVAGVVAIGIFAWKMFA